MRSVIGAPGTSAEYVGVLSIARRGAAFSAREQELLEYLAGQSVVSIENASLHSAVQRQAVTDELTGLANVRALHAILEREIERARRFGNSVGLVMVDLDDFKRVNDTHGHQRGDDVLPAVAGVLRDFSRDIDAPARYGGEELAVVLPGTDAEGAASSPSACARPSSGCRSRLAATSSCASRRASAWPRCRRTPPARRA